jgi:hypothetical protein
VLVSRLLATARPIATPLGLALLAAALGSGGLAPVAAADAPALTITSPGQGSFTNDTTPLFSGTATSYYEPILGEFIPVEVSIYSGALAAGAPTEKATAESPGSVWHAEAPTALAPGLYTAVASQTTGGESPPVSFTVDIEAPAPKIASPAAGAAIAGSSVTVAGSAGTGQGDLGSVTVGVYAGSVAGSPLESLEVPVHGGSWSGTLGGLAPGGYVLQAEQSDAAGNRGVSPAVAFTLKAPGTPAPPTAAFQWFPASPRAGEAVSIVSSSTDASSPITSFAWGVGASGPLRAGRSVLTRTFAKVGTYTVRLRVTDAAGRSSLATRSIKVRPRLLSLMQPFPIVRIAGAETATGVHLSLLTVAAPTSSRVSVRMRGTGLRTTSESRVARVGRHPSASQLLAFPRFERALPAGAVLEIRVTKPGQIGKYTRFLARRGKLPTRSDACLNPSGKPIMCPST